MRMGEWGDQEMGEGGTWPQKKGEARIDRSRKSCMILVLLEDKKLPSLAVFDIDVEFSLSELLLKISS